MRVHNQVMRLSHRDGSVPVLHPGCSRSGATCFPKRAVQLLLRRQFSAAAAITGAATGSALSRPRPDRCRCRRCGYRIGIGVTRIGVVPGLTIRFTVEIQRDRAYDGSCSPPRQKRGWRETMVNITRRSVLAVSGAALAWRSGHRAGGVTRQWRARGRGRRWRVRILDGAASARRWASCHAGRCPGARP